MNWQTFTVFGMLFLSALTALSLAIFAWNRKEIPGSRPFAMMTLSLAGWSIFYGLEVWAQDISTITLWSKFQYLGIAFIPVGWFLFAMSFSGRAQWWRPAVVAALSIIPALTVLSAFTNELHRLHWAAIQLNTDGPFIMMDASYGLGWWIYFVYAYLLLLVGSIVLVIALWNFSAAYRWQLVLLVLSPILPWVGNALYIARISPVPQLDLGPFAFTGSAIILGWGIFRFHLFDIVPVARSAVVDNMGLSMFVLDQRDRLVDVNPAALHLLDRTSEEVLGKTAARVFQRWPEIWASFADTAEVTEEISVRLGKSRQYLKLQVSPLYNRRGTTVGRLVMLSDVTAERLAEEAVALAQVRTEFLAKVGHELRTPLNGILGLVEMMSYGVYGEVNEPQAEALDKVIERTIYLTRLLNDLLQLTQLESGRFSFSIEEFQVDDLLNRLDREMRVAAETKNLRFTCRRVANAPAVVTGDATRIYQILVNLVDNAIKFTEAGRIDVIVDAPDDEHWSISVADTGVGIAEPMHKHLFEAFQQANYSITREHDGVGLGLAIVKQIVDAMGGEIEVISSEGQGTRFVVVLPRVHRPEENTEVIS